jgi:hypothetical protein
VEAPQLFCWVSLISTIFMSNGREPTLSVYAAPPPRAQCSLKIYSITLFAGGVQKIIHKLRNIISCSIRSAALALRGFPRGKIPRRNPRIASPLQLCALFSFLNAQEHACGSFWLPCARGPPRSASFASWSAAQIIMQSHAVPRRWAAFELYIFISLLYAALL